MKSATLLLSVLLLVAPAPVCAQVITASVNGIVLDPETVAKHAGRHLLHGGRAYSVLPAFRGGKAGSVSRAR